MGRGVGPALVLDNVQVAAYSCHVQRTAEPDVTTIGRAQTSGADRSGPGPGIAAELRLDADARALHQTLSELLRVFQFRDRDRICCHDVSVTQCHALGVLAQRDELTLNELATVLYLDKSTASRVVDALVTKGYVTRTPHPGDRRALQLALTPAGRALYEQIDGELLAELRTVAAGFAPEVRQAMTRMLGELLSAAGSRFLPDGCCVPAACCSAEKG
jgi:MarR family 2-MHQ and catechol resistance regulon transcriptional repressor